MIGVSSFLLRERRARDHRIHHRRGGGARNARDRCDRVEQRSRRAASGPGRADAGGTLTRALRNEGGLATLETTFAITLLVPLLFSILEFGTALERWLAQDAATVQAARYAGEVGGDAPEVRTFVADELRAAGIEPDRVTVEIMPARVGWREPIRVSLASAYPVTIPFLFSTTLPLRSSAISRGEVNR